MSNKSSDALHRLIKSMTKPEKRYFKVFTTRHIIGDGSNYQMLFDAIDRQAEYDEQKLLKKLKDKTFVKRFSISKNRLYAALLKSLDSFHSNSSVDAQLQKQLHAIEILYHKSLYDQCAKLLLSAQKIAVKHEKFTILVEVNKWEKRLIEKDNYETAGELDRIEKILQADRTLAQTLQSSNELWFIKSKIFVQLYQNGKVRSHEELDNLKKIMDEAVEKLSGKMGSVENEYMVGHIYSAYYFSMGKYTECYPYLLGNLRLIDKKPHLFREEPHVYISVLTNAIYVGMRLGKWAEAMRYVEKLRKLPQQLQLQQSEDLDIRMFSMGQSTELMLYAQSGEFEKGLELIPTIEKGLVKFEEHLSSIRKAHFYFNISVIYFGAEQFKESLKWINKLLNNVEIDKTRDIHCMAQILNLVIHLELGNNDLLPYALRSTKRYLETRHKAYRFETVMLQFINEVLKKRQDKLHQELFESLVKELEILRADPLEHGVFEYFDFLAWTRSKVNGKKYRELLAA